MAAAIRYLVAICQFAIYHLPYQYQLYDVLAIANGRGAIYKYS